MSEAISSSKISTEDAQIKESNQREPKKFISAEFFWRSRNPSRSPWKRYTSSEAHSLHYK